MIGKTVGSIRRVSTWVPAGSCVMIWVMAALTCRVALAMSRPQLKLIEISAAPRVGVERTCAAPPRRPPARRFHRPRHLHLHLLGRAVAGVERYHHARKVDRREKRNRQL